MSGSADVSGSPVAARLVRTPRLVLTPLDPALARAIDSGERAPDWAEGFPQEGDVRVAGMLVAGSQPDGEPGSWSSDPLWGPWAVRTLDGRLIGTAGFHGPPEAGTVEIGYGIEPGHRGLGLGSEAVRGLIELASTCAVAAVVARVAPANEPSMRLLRGLGFHPIGDASTPRSGSGSGRADDELVFGLALS